jgi:hypothetical protein
MKREPFRLLLWLVVGLACYQASIFLGTDYPQTQTALWKFGHVTTFGWVGYWIARNALGRLARTGKAPTTGQYIGRAIVIGCAMIAGAHGL